jgi:short-subunit dehydrogenase
VRDAATHAHLTFTPVSGHTVVDVSGAVVLGAGPGIGRSVACRFARDGMPVTVVARSRPTVDAVATSLEANGVDVLALTADVADEDRRNSIRGRAAAE